MSNIKTVYEFEIKNEVEVDKIETKTEGEGADAKTVQTTTKVKEPRSVFFAIKKPNKMEREECDIVHDVAFKYFVDRGIITEGNLRKQYGDNGGVYTTEEEKHYASLREKMRQLVEEYQDAIAINNQESNDKAATIFGEIFKVRKGIMDFEKTAALFYERTAEARARKKAIEHYFVNLTYTHDEIPLDKPIEWKPFFQGTNEDKLKRLAQLEDDADTTYLRIRDRIMLVCLAMINNTSLTPEQIEERMQEFDAN